ncbi:hypothetical protein PINS_up012447 [Pythium insidiosum]|nr:hypothetical protein PINS_up012447 [Pythium insidiosum]
MDFGDSPRATSGSNHAASSAAASASAALLDDPFAAMFRGQATVAAPPPPANASSAVDDPFATLSSTSGLPPPVPASSASSVPSHSGSNAMKASSGVAAGPVGACDTPAQLHFFVSCCGVEGNLIQPAARTAQTLMRGALNMLAQKSPRTKAPSEVAVEVRVAREFPVVGRENDAAMAMASGGPPILESESYWSERRKSRNPHFAVGFNVLCNIAAMRDRHIQIMVMVPDENSATTKNAQLFGYAQTSFQELFTIATTGQFQQRVTLPVHSQVRDGATVEIRFADLHATVPDLFRSYNAIFRSYLFYPLMKEDQERVQAVAPKLAIEEALEVDFSVKIPLQLLRVCHAELRQMYDEWKARYNYNRKKSRHFEDDAEALNFGHDVFRVQVICGRQLSSPLAGNGSTAGEGSTAGSRPSTFSIAGGRNAIMGRLKSSDGSNGGNAGANGSSGVNAAPSLNTFVLVRHCDGRGATKELVVGRTNTEYETNQPVWSTNKSPNQCPHGKPNLKLMVSSSLPTRVEVSPVNQLKQFLFYRPSVRSQAGGEDAFVDVDGWLRFELYHESYGIMSGIENQLMGEVLVPLQSVRDAMTVEEATIWDGEEGSGVPHSLQSLTLVDWFDVQSPTTDEVCGQIQLRINVLLANPVARGDGSEALLVSPRRQRLAADSMPPSSNPLESEMPLSFLYPHVLALQKQIAQVADMIRLCEQLVAQRRTFKSSQHKKRADIQGIPTNLHVSYFRILRHFGATCTANPAPTVRKASTEDLLGIGPAPSTNSASSSSTFSTLHERAMFAETHATITCGAPTAHAMGLSENGLREMELDIHRLTIQLDRYNPQAASGSNAKPPSRSADRDTFITEDAAEYTFFALGNSDDDEDRDTDDDTSPSNEKFASPQTSPSQDVAQPNPSKSTAKKYTTMASRAVAGARAKAAKRKIPTLGRGRSKGSDGDASDAGAAGESKYPPLKTEPEEGVDPTTSQSLAVRVLCRLEMLRAEYYLRKSVSVSQSVSSLVACFLAKLDLHLKERNHAALEQLARIGFLIGWESLISSHGKELRMLSDAWVAIKCLETFSFQLHSVNDASGDEDDESQQDVILEKREEIGYTIRVPIPARLFALLPPSLQGGQLISITTVLFTQGINEMQSLANMVGHSGVSIQSKINSTSLQTIVDYYKRFTAAGLTLAESHVGSHPDEILRNLRASVETENSASKNTCILFHAADAVRSLNGGRITYCKSGKDRTAMSVTLEQARLLVQRKRHVLQELLETTSSGSNSPGDAGPLEEVKDAANTMREFGVRIEIAKKNVGRYKYSFNSLQRKLLPEIYRPPMSTIQDMVTSVTARDS